MSTEESSDEKSSKWKSAISIVGPTIALVGFIVAQQQGCLTAAARRSAFDATVERRVEVLEKDSETQRKTIATASDSISIHTARLAEISAENREVLKALDARLSRIERSIDEGNARILRKLDR